MTIELGPPQSQPQQDLPSSASSGRFSPNGDPLGPAAFEETEAPTRPATAPVRGIVGTFGVGYQTYGANGPDGYSLYAPDNGLGIGQRLQLQGLSADTNLIWDYLDRSGSLATDFAIGMKNGGWKSSFTLVDNQLTTAKLTGSGTPFNQVNLGLLMLHGTYGTSEDYNGGVNCKQMYFPITSGTSAQYLSMSQMNFGGPGTNGLKWMAIYACRSLQHSDWSSMQSQGVKPYNSNLHLLLGCDTVCFDANFMLGSWSLYMTYGNSTNYNPMTIQNAWYQGAQYAYKISGVNYGTTLTFAVAGDSACVNDTLQTNSAPTGNWQYFTQQVWSP
jgi:hypothetical protein